MGIALSDEHRQPAVSKLAVSTEQRNIGVLIFAPSTA
jgi:hypothetical protein